MCWSQQIWKWVDWVSVILSIIADKETVLA